jgi:hypothetical protein
MGKLSRHLRAQMARQRCSTPSLQSPDQRVDTSFFLTTLYPLT